MGESYTDQQRAASLAVASMARDADDCRQLLAILDLLPPIDDTPQDGREHGRMATYRDGCRCSACRKANADRHREWCARAARNPEGADRAGHGKAATYNNHGCRCSACTDAHMARINAYRARIRGAAA